MANENLWQAALQQCEGRRPPRALLLWLGLQIGSSGSYGGLQVPVDVLGLVGRVPVCTSAFVAQSFFVGFAESLGKVCKLLLLEIKL